MFVRNRVPFIFMSNFLKFKRRDGVSVKAFRQGWANKEGSIPTAEYLKRRIRYGMGKIL